MKQVVLALGVLFITSMCHTSNAWASDTEYMRVRFSYGTNQLLPSLLNNANVEFDTEKSYSDFWIEGGFKISEKLSFQAAVQATDQPHELINTKYSRPDYPITTGRIQTSVLNYSAEAFEICFGRANMLSDGSRTGIFDYPLYADGLTWRYKWKAWSFKHVFQVLPAERHSSEVFRRSVSYHHLNREISNFYIGIGEYFILTGDNIGFDLKRLNPFLPYFLNSHDSEVDIFPGYSGDSDNSLIKLFLEWRGKSSSAFMNLYIDEFQIDAIDREENSDALLLSLSIENELYVFGQRNVLNWGLSVSNPNFGQHPGPFTASLLGIYPLFENAPGMKNLIYIGSQSFIGDAWEVSFVGYSERWVNISELSPAQMNKHEFLDPLDIHSDSRYSLTVHYDLKQLPITVGLSEWIALGVTPSSGYLISLDYDLGGLIGE